MRFTSFGVFESCLTKKGCEELGHRRLLIHPLNIHSHQRQLRSKIWPPSMTRPIRFSGGKQRGTRPGELWDLRYYEVTDYFQVPHRKHGSERRCGFVASTYSCCLAQLSDPSVRRRQDDAVNRGFLQGPLELQMTASLQAHCNLVQEYCVGNLDIRIRVPQGYNDRETKDKRCKTQAKGPTT